MLPETYDYRRTKGLLSDEAVAYELRDLLVNSADVGRVGDAGTLALINDEMRESLFGAQSNGNGGSPAYSDEVLDELNETIADATRPMGRVFWLLQDAGYTLCTTRCKRKANLSSGATVVVSKMGRFVTSDADVALAFRIEPTMARLSTQAERAMYQLVEDTRRIPALAAKVPTVISRTNQAVAGELTTSAVPKPDTNGGGQ